MNQLFRGAVRSGCQLRAGWRVLSTSEAATAACAPNLAGPHDGRGHRPATVDSRRDFSSVSAATKLDPRNDDGTFVRPAPSALERAALGDDLTPGRALHVLQKYAANGAGFIRQSDFVALCDSARPGKMTDAKVVATALREFKKNNRFVLQVPGCRAAMSGMMRGATPTWQKQDGRPRVRAASFVLEQVLDDATGLYFSVETKLVDEVLGELQRGLLEMEASGFELRVNENEGGGIGEAESDPSADEKMLKDALRLTGEVIRLLIKRKCRPHLDMKKRARRVYLKKLQFSGGPYASTMQLATHISILIGGSGTVQGSLIDPWEEAWWTKHKTVDPAVRKMIEDASAMEAAQREAKEAAEASDEASEEGVEGDDSNEKDANEGEEEEEADNSETDTDVEEKKD